MAKHTAEIENWFVFHNDPAKVPAYVAIRESAKALAHLLDKHVPECADKMAAIRKLREAVMTANAGIACCTDYKPAEG